MGRGYKNDQGLSQGFPRENPQMSIDSRRTFMKASGAAVAAACAGVDRLAAAQLRMPIGLQLYSVRELLPKDFDGTLRKLSAAGYTEVEAAGYYDRSAADFRHAMDQAGLVHGELIEYGNKQIGRAHV